MFAASNNAGKDNEQAKQIVSVLIGTRRAANLALSDPLCFKL